MLLHVLCALACLEFISALVPASTCNRPFVQEKSSREGASSESAAFVLYAKKRRSRAKSSSQQIKTTPPPVLKSPDGSATAPPMASDKVFAQGTIGGEPFVVPNLDLQKTDSKLTPLSGTAEAKKQAFEEGTNGVERFLDRMTAPTPKGKEPEAVKLMKQITWGAVIVCVLIEIYVSVKVGGAPFDIDKISTPSLPSLPTFKMFTGGAGPAL